MTERFSHFDARGNARMVDVGAKAPSQRVAIATGTIFMSNEAYRLLCAGTIAKGDVLGVARIAGIMAAKKTSDIIPLTHPLSIDRVDIAFTLNDTEESVGIEATVGTTGKTGVEMEALTAVSAAALTIYDMCKAVDKKMVISDICLLKKTGGKSGTFVRE